MYIKAQKLKVEGHLNGSGEQKMSDFRRTAILTVK
jgi:hypothetical protein